MTKEFGLVYVFTGNGKGKTSAAIGTAIRAAGAGMSVAWVAFYKQASWKLSELEPLKKLGVEVWLMGKGFNIRTQNSPLHQGFAGQAIVKVQNHNLKLKSVPLAGGAMAVDSASEEEHKQAAELTLNKAKELAGTVDVLVLDEVNNALQEKLIDLVGLIDLISKRKHTHLILTGRGAKKEVIERADLVTEMKKVKHPYDKGMLALRGMDF